MYIYCYEPIIYIVFPVVPWQPLLGKKGISL